MGNTCCIILPFNNTIKKKTLHLFDKRSLKPLSQVIKTKDLKPTANSEKETTFNSKWVS